VLQREKGLTTIMIHISKQNWKKPKCPGDTVEVIMKLPNIPTGEDETSFGRHKKYLYTYYPYICMHACTHAK